MLVPHLAFPEPAGLPPITTVLVYFSQQSDIISTLGITYESRSQSLLMTKCLSVPFVYQPVSPFEKENVYLE